MNFSIEYIGVPSANPVALKNWYERVLGARLIWDNGRNPPTFCSRWRVAVAFYFLRIAKVIYCIWLSVRGIFVAAVCDRRKEKKLRRSQSTAIVIFSARGRRAWESKSCDGLR